MNAFADQTAVIGATCNGGCAITVKWVSSPGTAVVAGRGGDALAKAVDEFRLDVELVKLCVADLGVKCKCRR
jgi:hypothetical protein